MSKISIITPSFNQGEFIRDTIESVLAQDYPNVEHIVVDGGSTDNTVEILKSYKHLIWTSEPDNGQTDALNKGFAKSTGDIVTWLNSDDWYEPNIFPLVAEELKIHSMIVGACQITDRAGKVDYTVVNVPRTWHDLLKYWCSYSIPTQPSIFFRRSVIEEVRRHDGKLLDEELYYCMDYDLWMRVWGRHTVKQIPKVFSYYRMYEDNKTGQGNDPLLPEMSRIFNRYSHAANIVERGFSYIVPVNACDDALKKTLENLSQQSMTNFEVLLVDYSEDRKVAKELRKLLSLKDGEIGKISSRLRYVRSLTRSFGAALNVGAQSSCSLYLSFLHVGATVPSNFALEAIKIFREDRVSIIIPSGSMSPLKESLKGPDGHVQVDKLFSSPFTGMNFAIRKVALQDVGWFKHTDALSMSSRELLVRAIHKGWFVNNDNSLEVAWQGDLKNDQEYLSANSDLITSQIISDCAEEIETDPFTKMRVGHGYALNFPDSLVADARAFLKSRQ